MKNFMKEAVIPSHKGLFKKKAEAAGKSTSEFAAEHAHSPGVLGKEARLAEVFEKERPKGALSKRYGAR